MQYKLLKVCSQSPINCLFVCREGGGVCVVVLFFLFYSCLFCSKSSFCFQYVSRTTTRGQLEVHRRRCHCLPGHQDLYFWQTCEVCEEWERWEGRVRWVWLIYIYNIHVYFRTIEYPEGMNDHHPAPTITHHHAASTQHPRSTHATSTQHPRSIHAAPTQHPRSTHAAPRSPCSSLHHHVLNTSSFYFFLQPELTVLQVIWCHLLYVQTTWWI